MHEINSYGTVENVAPINQAPGTDIVHSRWNRHTCVES